MSTSTNLTTKHLLLALLTVFIWGTNFIAIYIGLKEFPPFLLCAARFGLAAFPWVFILPRPKAPFKLILGFGVFNFAMQFGLMFTGIHLGLSPGLSSLVLQVQVFFSMALAYMFFREKPSLFKIIGSLISFVGIGIVASHINGSATLIGLILTLVAALSWAFGNIYTKKINSDSPLSLVVWGNLVAFPFMMILSFIFEGSTVIVHSVQNVSWSTIAAVFYIVYLSTHLGYGLWGYLIKTYSTSAVVPFTLLVPVVGFITSALVLNEELTSWKIIASLFIMGGLIFNLFEKSIRKILNKLTKKTNRTIKTDSESILKH